MMNEEHVLDLIPAYALGILDESELILVEGHLPGCTQCRNEYQAYKQVVDDLPLAIALSQPPLELKSRVLQRVQARKTNVQSSKWESFWARFKGSLHTSAPAWVMVCLALVMILAVSNLFLWQRLNLVSTAEGDIMQTVALQGTEYTPNATGILVVSRDGMHGTLVVDGLPVLSEAQQYQLWLIYDGERDSGGVFSVDVEGYGSLWVSSEKPLISYQAVGITVEPAGGSLGPTGEKVLGGEL